MIFFFLFKNINTLYCIKNSIFLNQFLVYCDKCQEIIDKYSNLFPNYIYNIINERFEGNKNNF